MAIAFDAASNNYQDGFSGTMSHSHTCTGSDRLLFVAATVFDATPDIISGATYNGVAMTQIGAITQSANYRLVFFYLIAPSTGSNTLSITYSSGASPTRKGAAAASYTGTLQSGVPDSSNTSGSASTSSQTMTTTVVASNCWLVAGVHANRDNAAAGTGTIVRSSPSPTGTVTAWIFDSNGTVGTGSQSLVVTQSAAGVMAYSVASFAPSTGGGAVVQYVQDNLALLGVS